jgi:hypothetical protein
MPYTMHACRWALVLLALGALVDEGIVEADGGLDVIG